MLVKSNTWGYRVKKTPVRSEAPKYHCEMGYGERSTTIESVLRLVRRSE